VSFFEAFDTLFNKRDNEAAERYWSPDYIQQSAHLAPGRERLFNFIKSIPPTLKYEPGMIMADGDLVILHGRFSVKKMPIEQVREWRPDALSSPRLTPPQGALRSALNQDAPKACFCYNQLSCPDRKSKG
jgi:hypothetical protein